MVCILKISTWILFKKLRFVRILKDFPWQCEKLYSHAWVCQICGITILSRFHTRCQSRHWSVTRFLKLSHNNKDIKFWQLLANPQGTCCIWAGNASFILSLNLSPVVHQQVRLPDVFWGKTDVHYVVIFRFVPRQVDVVPLLQKENNNFKKRSSLFDQMLGERKNAQMLVGLVQWHWWPVWVVSLWSQKVMEVNFGPFGNIVFFIAMGQQMEMSISR